MCANISRPIYYLSQQLIQATGSGNCYQAPAKQVGGSILLGGAGVSGGGRWLRVTITPRAARAISFSSITRARRVRIFRNVRVDFRLFPFPKKAACHYQNKFNDLFYLFHLSVCFKGLILRIVCLIHRNKARTWTVIPQGRTSILYYFAIIAAYTIELCP